MTADQITALQVALYQRLVEHLATAAPDGGPLSVFDHVPEGPEERDKAHARIEGFAGDPVPTKNTRPLIHRFTVRLFGDAGREASAHRGQMPVKAIAETVIAALEDWRPFPGGNAVRHVSTQFPPAETGGGYEAASRFEIQI